MLAINRFVSVEGLHLKKSDLLLLVRRSVHRTEYYGMSGQLVRKTMSAWTKIGCPGIEQRLETRADISVSAMNSDC